MTIQSYGPTDVGVHPANASKVTVLKGDGRTPLTLTTPVAVDGSGRISWAADDGGAPPLHAIMHVTDTTGQTHIVRVTLPAPTPPAPSGYPASHVTFDPSGLIVVTGADVQTALAHIDTWAQGRPVHTSGHLALRPAAGSLPNGSTYLADDDNGGTTYRVVAGAWVQEAAGVAQAGGRELAFAAATAAASATTVFDVTGCQITFTVAARPVYVTALVPLVTSSAVNGAFTLTISDLSNTETAAVLDVASPTAGNGSGGGNTLLERISVPGTYSRKLRAQTGGASSGATTTVAWTATRAAHIKAVEA